jgi:hypothetical protein
MRGLPEIAEDLRRMDAGDNRLATFAYEIDATVLDLQETHRIFFVNSGVQLCPLKPVNVLPLDNDGSNKSNSKSD